MIYLKLLWSFFQIGLISFGGGYAAMTPIYNQVVEKHMWLSASQFSDLITISQMTPGPIALNSATFVGLQVAGFPGAVVATLGNILPSVMIVSALAFIYFKFSSLSVMKDVLKRLKPVVVSLIAVAGVSLIKNAMWTPRFDVLNLSIFIASLIILRKTKLDPTMIILLTGIVGIVGAIIT